MKFIQYLLLAIPLLILGQQNEIWHSFYDNERKLKGFKDANGEIKIEPKFWRTPAQKFDKIIAVTDSKFDRYYLLKNGYKFGTDSVYFFDFSHACESEGFIKFEDIKNEKIGLFNSEGKVAVPSEYDIISQVVNGHFVGVKGAEKEYWDKSNHTGCNHWSWTGGNENLMDTLNNVIIEDFKFTQGIDFYSMRISETLNKDNSIVSYKGKNGLFYSFVDNELLFKNQFNTLLSDISKENISLMSYDKIIFYDKNSLISLPKKEYYEKYYSLVLKRLKMIGEREIEYEIGINYIFPFENNLKFISNDIDILDNCGEINISKYPVISVIASHIDKKGKVLYQDNFNFIKFDGNFKLINILLGKN